MTTFLVVDDDAPFRERLVKALSQRGYTVSAAGDFSEAQNLISEYSYDCASFDLKLPGGNGIDLVPLFRVRNPEAKSVVLTGYGSIPTAVRAIQLGATNYLMKPATTEQILQALSESSAASPVATQKIAVPSLPRVEWEHIQRVMNECEGNITKAAKLLGLHRKSLQRKLSKNPVRK